MPDPIADERGDAVGSVAVNVPGFAAPGDSPSGQDGHGCRTDALFVGPEQLIHSPGQGKRSFRRVAQREARHAQDKRLLLGAARIREEEPGRGEQADELDVAQRFGTYQAVFRRRRNLPWLHNECGYMKLLGSKKSLIP